MGTLQGKDIRARIKTGPDADDFVNLGGETSVSWRRQSQEIDISDKDSGAYGGSTYGQQKVTVSVSGNVKLPDIGLEKAFNTSKTSPPEGELQIVRGATVLFQSAVGIGNFSIEGGKDSPATYSFDATNTVAPTIDDLGAA